MQNPYTQIVDRMPEIKATFKLERSGFITSQECEARVLDLLKSGPNTMDSLLYTAMYMLHDKLS